MKKQRAGDLALAIEDLGEGLRSVCVALAGLVRQRKPDQQAVTVVRVPEPRPAAPPEPRRRQLLTVRQFVRAYPAFTEGSVRWLLFNGEWNRFEEAIVRVGHRVLIDTDKFERWLELPAKERRSTPHR